VVVLRLGTLLDLDLGLSVSSLDDLERPEFDILLDNRVIEFSSDESLGIEDSVLRISGDLVLGCISD